MILLSKISNKAIFICIFILICIKLITYFLIKNDYISFGLGGGSDANYYHGYALGYNDVAVNFWPVILRFFNDLGFYFIDRLHFFV